MITAKAIERSDNAKIGNASATYASQGSCPKSCPLLGAGCYAELGMVGIQTRRLNAAGGNSLSIAKAEAKAIDTLSGINPLRLHVVGDASTNRAASILADASARFTAKHGRPVWTYTHAWRKVKRKSWGGVSVLASAHTVADAKAAMAKGYAAAITLPKDSPDHAFNRDGIKILPCPATTRGVRCSECKLCFKDSYLKRAGIVIGFPIHGPASTLYRINRSLSNELRTLA